MIEIPQTPSIQCRRLLKTQATKKKKSLKPDVRPKRQPARPSAGPVMKVETFEHAMIIIVA